MAQLVFVNAQDVNDDGVRMQIRSRAAAYSRANTTRRPRGGRQGGRTNRNSKTDAAQVLQDEARSDGGKDAADLYAMRTSKGLVAVRSFARPSRLRTVSARPTSSITYGYDSSSSDDFVSPPAPYSSAVRAHLALDPFGTFPIPLIPWMQGLLVNSPIIIRRGWQTMEATEQERSMGEQWVMSLVFSDPTYCYLQVMTAVDDAVQHGRMPRSLSLWLTGQAVSSLNQDLLACRGRPTLAVVCSVNRITLREIVWGDRVAGATMHRPALARMLALTNALGDFDIPPLVLRHWLWSTRLCSALTGKLLVDLEPALAGTIFDERTMPGGSQMDQHILASFFPQNNKVRRLVELPKEE